MESPIIENELRREAGDLTEDLTEDIEKQSCVICSRDDVSSESMCSTDCSHLFCKNCLDEWLDQGKKTCPMCRKTIRYFKSDDIQYRVIIQSERPSTATISRSVVERIIRQNYNMRYIIFLMFLAMLAGFNAYTVLANNYNYLNFRYVGAQQNITVLTEALDECQHSNGGFREVLVYVLQIQGSEISNVLKKCVIPLFSYHKCFPE